MKKVISIAISTLLLSNVSLADITSADNGLLQSIQQKIDTKKSNLGSNVQTNSGLSGFNKDLVKSVSNEPIASPSKLNTEISKVEVKPVVSSTELKQSNNLVNKKEEICEPVKTTVKKIIKRPIKKAVKITPKPVKNDFDLVKTQNYTPIDFSTNQKWILNNQIKLNIQDNLKVLEVSISDSNGKVIPKEQFNKSFIRVVQISQDFNKLNHQENEMNFSNTSFLFDKTLENCGAIFVQYHLKSSSTPTNLVKYVDQNGLLTNSIDSSCKSQLPQDLSTNLNYSVLNNMSGLFFKNDKLVATKPINFNILFLKNGLSRTPNDLFVYAVKQDFSDLNVLEPQSFGTAASGISYENTLEKGKYILGYSFNEGSTENYFKNINVE